MQDGQGRPDGQVKIVVVVADAERQEQYEAALESAGAPSLTTLDAGEAEAAISEHRPDVLVLDEGLPRLVLFRLYGLVREDDDASTVHVVFVGQDGETGPDDHYLPGERAPSAVAAQITSLVERESKAADDGEPGAAPSGSAETSPAPSANGQSQRPASAAPSRTNGAAIAATGHPQAVPVGTMPAEAAAADPAAAPGRSGYRLDVIFVRVGLALLVVGGLLILLQVQMSQAPIIAPTPVPTTQPRRAPASPSPSPAAGFEAPRPSGQVVVAG